MLFFKPFYSFTAAAAAPPPVVTLPVVVPSGGRPQLTLRDEAQRQYRERQKRQKLQLIQAAREAIEEVARRQVERLELDEQKRFEELERELSLRSVEWEARYLDLLNEERESLIDEEIGRLLRRKIAEEDELLLILLDASL